MFFDKIDKKLKEIHEQPEHIRLRWVWGMLFVSMFIVIFIWVINVRVNFLNITKKKETTKEFEQLQEEFKNIKNTQQKKEDVSIDDLLESTK